MNKKVIATLSLTILLTLNPCGIALIRLRKPLSYYQKKYNDAAWGIQKLFLLMEKQRNRGQDGAGIAVVKFDPNPGQKFLLGKRLAGPNAITNIFHHITDHDDLDNLSLCVTDQDYKNNFDFIGEVYLGHVRYGTHGGFDKNCCQPKICKNDLPAKSIAIAGNFNLTNTPQLLAELVNFGICPTQTTDTHSVLDFISYCLNREYHYLEDQICQSMPGASFNKNELYQHIASKMDPARILQWATKNWDGGYLFAGIIGNGDTFICRDPSGIRPGYLYIDNEVVAVASERAALANVFDTNNDNIKQLNPGMVFVIKRDGTMYESPFIGVQPKKECQFERIYFSRMNDPEIYQERKALGKQLAPRILEELNDDISRAVFCYIPNSGETSFLGLIEEINRLVRIQQAKQLWLKVKYGIATAKDFEVIANVHVRTERLVYKDQSLRTFITNEASRADLVSHIYDVTKNIITPQDTLVVMDDSIVRGITLQESIITQLSRLNPKRIIFVSSCPPIKYPDCYGIDMSQLNHFIAFKAAQEIIKDRRQELLLDQITEQCLRQNNKVVDDPINYVKKMYEQCSLQDLEDKIAELVRPDNIEWEGELKIIYQSLEGLYNAIPNFSGDWVFTGNYPTQGGFHVVTRSYLNQYFGHDLRAY